MSNNGGDFLLDTKIEQLPNLIIKFVIKLGLQKNNIKLLSVGNNFKFLYLNIIFLDCNITCESGLGINLLFGNS